MTELFVHHVDEDETNDDASNLVAMHRPCHQKLHHTGKQVSAETRRKLADARRGRTTSTETREKIAATLRARAIR